MKDDWDAPIAPSGPLAPGLKLDPHQPKIELEKVEFVEPDPDDLVAVEELRAQNKRLMKDNAELMRQIEESWTIIRARDETIRLVQEYQHQPWQR